ncbi:hypothetical protein QJQ45_013059 [Haematococcus lacustris]|nr:hypothetical protein QJQ45_013059 [Haematococcus lacustris]
MQCSAVQCSAMQCSAMQKKKKKKKKKTTLVITGSIWACAVLGEASSAKANTDTVQRAEVRAEEINGADVTFFGASAAIRLCILLYFVAVRVAGGSNAVGENGAWDGGGSDQPCVLEDPQRILMWAVRNQSWTAAVRNVHGVSLNNAAPSDATGPDIPFARALLASGTSQRVGIIPVAAGGTNLFNNWMPENNAFFDAMINQTRRAMAAAAPNARLRGMLMMLGEGDAMTIYNWNSAWNPQGVMWSYSFNSLMTRLITTARARLAQYHPLLPVALSLQAVTGRDRVYPYISVIREQTQAMQLPNLVKADMEGCAMYDVDFSSFNGYLGIYGWVGQQAIHLSRAGQCCMAQRFADAYLAALPTMNTTAARS